jgi:hypothetical protein
MAKAKTRKPFDLLFMIDELRFSLFSASICVHLRLMKLKKQTQFVFYRRERRDRGALSK